MTQFDKHSTAEEVTEGVNLEGQIAVVSGVNSGIGHETARVLSLRGAKVFGTARTLEKAAESCREISDQAVPIACELTDLNSIASAVNTIKSQVHKIDMLVANAGIMAPAKLETVDGLEKQFATNHIGHFLFVTALQDLVVSARGRIMIVSSGLHRQAPVEGIQFDNLDGSKGYNKWWAYGQSKLANILFAKELARKLKDVGVAVNALHPGVIMTKLSRHMTAEDRSSMGGSVEFKTVPQGAATSCYLATNPGVQDVTGKYFADCREEEPSQLAQSASLAKQLWERSEQIVSAALS